MFCPSCHTRNQFFNNYCYFCGHKLKEANNTSHNSQEDQQEDQDKEYILDPETFDIIQEDQDHEVQEEKVLDHEVQEEKPQEDTYEFLFENDELYDDNDLFSNSDLSEFDLTTQIPLRRYQKDKPYHKSRKVLKVLLSIFTLALVGLAIFLWVRQIGHRVPRQASLSQSIAVSSSIEETTKDGEKAYRIVFNTVNGKEISFMGDAIGVENGRAEFIIEDALLYTYSPELTEDGLYEVKVDAIVSAPNLPDSTERVSIALSPPYRYAPFTLLQPSTSETEFQGDRSKVAFNIQPDSKVIINEQDFTDLIAEDGRFEKEFRLSPQQEELVLDIRVSTPGYLDNIQQIILRKAAMDVPLTLDETFPIASNEQWIEISGITHPEATLEADLEIFEEPKIDGETGAFTIYVKAERPGYTPCTLTAKLDNEKSSLEIILERKASVDTYTSTAWKPDYDKLQQDVELSNGRHFVFVGNIKDIIETGDKSIFTISLSEQSEPEQLFYVEYWGSFDYSAGDKIRVFGNRWGNKNNLPRILAKYIYD